MQLVGRQAAELAEEVADVGVGAVEALGDGVDLGAVARRLSTTASRMLSPADEAGDRLAAARRDAIASRSSSASGPVRWFTPMTTIDT